ncbi:MAG: TdeIII family type II restriction endonuclease, partial [Elusimicrobia bacterium]|nr:TdeIII family type II restriction endonuclease [Elusimicrobiota bacterium]
MASTQDQQNRISEVIKDILLSRIENFPEIGAEIRNAPFHSALMECFRNRLKPLNIEIPYLIAIASWLHGLNTSLGTGFENISHILSGGYKRKFTGSYKLSVKEGQATQIESIVRDLKSGKQKPDLEREDELIFNFIKSDKEIDSLPFTVDTYIERKDKIIAIELKSVRPNSGEGRGEKQKILYGKAALKLQNPDKEIQFLIGFPFDPTSVSPTGYDKRRFFNYLI